VDQISSSKLEARVGGIYSLDQIAQQSDNDRWVVYELLCSFIRENARWGRGPKAVGTLARLPNRLPDVHSALTVIGRREVDLPHVKVLDLHQADLRGAHLQGAHLEFIQLAGVRLNDAFMPRAKLDYSGMYGADLQDADLSAASLINTGLPEANLRNASLEGANLNRAILKGANLKGANLSGARLDDVELTGAVSDRETQWPAGFDWRGAGVRISNHP
jgi:uncharacterized protein YjbI with pentapeptide repeats